MYLNALSVALQQHVCSRRLSVCIPLAGRLQWLTRQWQLLSSRMCVFLSQPPPAAYKVKKGSICERFVRWLPKKAWFLREQKGESNFVPSLKGCLIRSFTAAFFFIPNKSWFRNSFGLGECFNCSTTKEKVEFSSVRIARVTNVLWNFHSTK